MVSRSLRSSQLVKNFIGQYLYLRNIERIAPDSGSFPNFDENLRASLAQETELVVDSTLREDRSVLNLLKADYTFLNERLAKHYGIPNVYGTRMRRVTLVGHCSVRNRRASSRSCLSSSGKSKFMPADLSGTTRRHG